MKEIHIGEIIKKRVTELGISTKILAKAINCDRTNIYKIYKRKSIDIEQLIRISEILDYDFIKNVYLKETSFPEEECISSCTIKIKGDTILITKDNNKSFSMKLKKDGE